MSHTSIKSSLGFLTNADSWPVLCNVGRNRATRLWGVTGSLIPLAGISFFHNSVSWGSRVVGPLQRLTDQMGPTGVYGEFACSNSRELVL